MVAVQRVAIGSILLYLCIFSSPTYHILEEVVMANFRLLQLRSRWPTSRD